MATINVKACELDAVNYPLSSDTIEALTSAIQKVVCLSDKEREKITTFGDLLQHHSAKYAIAAVRRITSMDLDLLKDLKL